VCSLAYLAYLSIFRWLLLIIIVSGAVIKQIP
jgi:hypothetical protein